MTKPGESPAARCRRAEQPSLHLCSERAISKGHQLSPGDHGAEHEAAVPGHRSGRRASSSPAAASPVRRSRPRRRRIGESYVLSKFEPSRRKQHPRHQVVRVTVYLPRRICRSLVTINRLHQFQHQRAASVKMASGHQRTMRTSISARDAVEAPWFALAVAQGGAD